MSELIPVAQVCPMDQEVYPPGTTVCRCGNPLEPAYSYRVEWAFDVDEALTPRDAAKKALECMENQISGNGAPPIFSVFDTSGTETWVDFEEENDADDQRSVELKEPTNRDRAESALKSLHVHKKGSGQSGVTIESIVDLMADLLHLAVQEGHNAKKVHSQALQHFEQEMGEPLDKLRDRLKSLADQKRRLEFEVQEKRTATNGERLRGGLLEQKRQELKSVIQEIRTISQKLIDVLVA